ncbi:winged helix-turn-helix domain-containing protein [Nitrosarchaeum koreense]|uniref:Transcriptional regulator, ArsR family n=1 Tax=Nitrosarchaeum koreense MY1 TaxID=1001994 RepID=F9CWG7_9ARCH|nr:winged helix-turn-helix domain-containing protein [Nitrosarchaeum koreense]EGP93619.1 Transcriptional regulator, ArsR family [Nitrosarchaeum koreense MY1]
MKDEIGDALKDTEGDTIGIADRVEILSTEDSKLKSVGEILSSDSSRAILKILFNDSLTANQISQKTEISLPLVIYHLKKMQDAGVVKITNIGKNTKSHDMKFYTVDKLAIVILPAMMSEPAKKSKSLFNSFTRIHRLATLGGASIAAWFSSQLIQKGNVMQDGDMSANTQMPPDVPEMAFKSIPEESADVAMESVPIDEMARMSESADTMMKSSPIMDTAPMTQAFDPIVQILWSVVTVLIVVVAGLVIEVVITKRRKNIAKH